MVLVSGRKGFQVSGGYQVSGVREEKQKSLSLLERSGNPV